MRPRMMPGGTEGAGVNLKRVARTSEPGRGDGRIQPPDRGLVYGGLSMVMRSSGSGLALMLSMIGLSVRCEVPWRMTPLRSARSRGRN